MVCRLSCMLYCCCKLKMWQSGKPGKPGQVGEPQDDGIGNPGNG